MVQTVEGRAVSWLFLVQLEELRLGKEGGIPDLGREVRLVLSLPACFCPRGAVWWSLAARSIATVSSSCRKKWRNRRCRLRAADVSLAAGTAANMKLFAEVTQNVVVVVVVIVVVVVLVVVFVVVVVVLDTC